jgi:hypothetical protein
MGLNDDLEKAKNEVLRKIGRNMLLFQQVEHTLKFLIANGQFSGGIGEIKANKEQRAESVHKQTMGILAGQYLDEIHLGCEESAENQEELKEANLSFSFKVECDSVYYEERKKAMASIVDDRNDLIHHLLPKFNPNSFSSCLEIDQYLDKQREKIHPEFDLLHNMVENLQEGKRILAEFLTSKEGKNLFTSSLPRKSPVVTLLEDIAAQKARSDGWVPLSIAGQIIKQHAPDEISALHEKYGSKTMKALVLATELFELCEEATDGGGIRVLYRLKSDAHFNE